MRTSGAELIELYLRDHAVGREDGDRDVVARDVRDAVEVAHHEGDQVRAHLHALLEGVHHLRGQGNPRKVLIKSRNYHFTVIILANVNFN